MKKKVDFFDVIVVILMLLLMAIMIYPLLYTLSVSLSAGDEVTKVTFFPRGFTISAYIFIFSMPSVVMGYFHSILYTVTNTLIALVLTILCAYPLSKKWLPGRKIITIFILITMFFGGGLIPLYITISNLGMLDTIWAIVIPSALSSWYMIIARTFFQGLPVELEESAYVDGANEFVILRRIFLPLSKPILATLALFYGVAKWNSWFDASIYLSSKSKYPIQLILRNLMISSSTGGFDKSDISAAVARLGSPVSVSTNVLNYALTIAVVLPIIFIYPFLQKYFVKGVMVGSIKG